MLGFGRHFEKFCTLVPRASQPNCAGAIVHCTCPEQMSRLKGQLFDVAVDALKRELELVVLPSSVVLLLCCCASAGAAAVAVLLMLILCCCCCCCTLVFLKLLHCFAAAVIFGVWCHLWLICCVFVAH